VTASSCELHLCRKGNVHCTRVFNLLHPLPVDFRSNDVTSGSLPVTWVTWDYFLSRDCLLLRATGLWELICTVYVSYWPSTATSRRLTVKWDHFRVTSGHLRSLTSFPIRWLLHCASYSLVESEMYSVLESLPIYSHFQVTSDQFTSLPITWGHVTSFPATWLPPPVSYCLLKIEMCSISEFLAFYNNFQGTSGKMTSLLGPFWSPEVKWHNFLSLDWLLLRATAL